jgi:glycosyltransferase involved in cell wall biosynthesis
MKIAQFIQNKGMGGVEQCAVDYVSCLTAGGHKVYTIIPREGAYYEKFLRKLDTKIYKVDTSNKLKIILAFRKIIKKIKPDVFISHSGNGAILMKIAFPFKKFITIGIDHGYNPKKYLKWNKANYSFCVNTDEMKKTNDLAMSLGKRNFKAFYVPNMTDVGKNIVFDEKKKFHNPIRVGILTRIAIHQKSLDKIVEAVKILKDRGIEIKFYVGGDGCEMKLFKKYIADNDVKDRFILDGWIDDKAKFLKKLDIFCMPSRWETFGISYIEAMQYSLPCIVSNNWGANDIFTHNENALIVSKDDEDKMPEAIANAIEKLIKEPKFAKKLAKNAFKRLIENYSVKANSKKINKILEKISEKN